MSDSISRCVLCRSVFTKKQIENSNCCPKCGATGFPMSIKEDVEIHINWHELRILSLWAENWARLCDKDKIEKAEKEKYRYDPMINTIYAIIKPLQEQCPSFAPLTLSGEIRQIEEEFGDVQSNVPLDASLPPKRSS